MYFDPRMYPIQYPYQQYGYVNGPVYHQSVQPHHYMPYQEVSRQGFMPYRPSQDQGPQPYTLNINEAAKANNTYRTAIWTGEHLQVTLMSLNVGEDIGLEIHPHIDQFLRIEQGEGVVQMGKTQNQLNFVRRVNEDSAIMIPAGTWHNVTNTGKVPLKLYSIYAPPQHPRGTVHVTKADAMAAEAH
jgi:mannose-6-phosphate isomerase-like protein (cupin superfamily)